MKLQQRDKRAILLGAGVLLAAAVVHFAILPAAAAWRGVRQEVQQQDDALRALQLRLDQRDAMLRRLEDRYGQALRTPLQDVATTRTAFPEEVQKLLAGAQVKFETIELQGVQRLREAPGVVLVSLRVQGQCHPHAISKFLASAVGADRVVLVDRISASTKERPEQWSVNMVLSTPAIQGDAR